MTSAGTVAAIDLGASSGRVMLGHVGHNELSIRSVARFANNPVRTIDGLHWNILDLYRGAIGGLRAAVREEPQLLSVAVDSWAVDYALLRGQRMLGNPFHYRDERTAAGVTAVHALESPAKLYSRNGLQFLPFNTLYQLAAEQLDGGLHGADSMLLIPDLITFWLSGEKVAERTNASTTGLLRAAREPGMAISAGSTNGLGQGGAGGGEWDDELIARLGLPRGLFPRLIDAGSRVGSVLPDVLAEIGAGRSIDVTAVGSHDTASAVVAVPMTGPNAAYISSGTWSLVGVELSAPVLSEASRAANFTNEGGVDGRVRYLRNVMGLWLLSESLRTWEQSGQTFDLPGLLGRAGQWAGPVTVFDVDDPRFLAPGDMPSRIRAYCREHDLPEPATPVALVRSIVESLADAYARTLDRAAELSGTRIDTVHIVGGGSQNELLCQLTANRTGLPVLAGPVEATAIGNVLVQARAQGLVTGSLESLRTLVARAFAPRRYEPQG
ncbi:rhamnulokinase [Cryobacterium sp. Hh7]|uniref:rhamnulokinase n=1 Tax=Cryobacterium sp. Hh7 TaxID=1259159 RepID=UPI00106D904D|nr:rhamnulokinase family protein [Cryobacterium sp. Hh7]TFD56314.1 rhamnulokinase [Cryobacterium sp. Hh7]